MATGSKRARFEPLAWAGEALVFFCAQQGVAPDACERGENSLLLSRVSRSGGRARLRGAPVNLDVRRHLAPRSIVCPFAAPVHTRAMIRADRLSVRVGSPLPTEPVPASCSLPSLVPPGSALGVRRSPIIHAGPALFRFVVVRAGSLSPAANKTLQRTPVYVAFFMLV